MYNFPGETFTKETNPLRASISPRGVWFQTTTKILLRGESSVVYGSSMPDILVRPICSQGPCDYDPKLEPRYHLEMPGSAPFLSGVPKGDKRRQPSPGPGQYVSFKPLGANTSAGNVPNFASSTQRGAWLRSDQVGYHGTPYSCSQNRLSRLGGRCRGCRTFRDNTGGESCGTVHCTAHRSALEKLKKHLDRAPLKLYSKIPRCST